MTGRVRFWLSAALAVGLVLPTAAHAHGHLRASAPASGAHLGAAPRELRLTFSERVELAVARLELLGPDDRPVVLSAVRAGDSPAVIVADVTGPLVAGSYTVAWQIAGADGHPVHGRFRFTIAPGASGLATAATVGATSPRRDTAADSSQRPAATTAPPEGHHDPTTMPTGGGFDAESPLFAAARWLAYTAILALTGAVGFALVVVPRAARRASNPPGAVDGARTLGLTAAAALLVASVLRLAAQSLAMHGAADALDPGLVTTMVAHTTWGVGWLVQVGAALVALAGLVLARRGRAGWGVAAGAVLAVAVGAALSGHAAAVPGLTTLAVAADAAHVLGAGGWLGTLLVLVLVGMPSALRAPEGDRGASAAALVQAFSPVALACAGVVAVTGLAASWWHVGSVGALWTSAYGRVLLLKLGLLALVAGTGAYNWRRVLPAMGSERAAHRARRSSTVELLVGAVVLAVTAVLVALPTPLDPTQAMH